MTDTFRALVVTKGEEGQTVEIKSLTEGDLMEGEVTVRVEWSTLNYKDGLALTGSAPVLRATPMIPGIDFAGTVEASDDPRYYVGEAVLLNGWGVGESHYGGYAQMARVKGEWLVPLPSAFSARQAMAIGTAGYTAMLCVMALEEHGLEPEAGDVLVTGAAGGVGGVAIAVLAKLGYRVVASTGRSSESDYLHALGAAEIIDRAEFDQRSRPLGKTRWAGAIDCVGSQTLASVLSQMHYGRAVAACGLAGGMDLPTSVAPFILRGVTLIGVDSVMASRDRRLEAWTRLATDLDPAMLERMTSVVPLTQLGAAAPDILAGQVRGRMLVDVNA